MDRENIGGNMSGQQSNYISRGGNPTNNKWSLDGVDITDMSATGASPSYFDFDAFQEMTINTGGVDVTQQTGGVGINLVTKSGTDRFKGSTRYYVTDEQFQSNNVDLGAARAGRDLGQPDPGHQGLRRRSRRPDPARAARGCGAASASSSSTSASSASTSRRRPARRSRRPPVALAASIEDVNACLNTDRTLLQTTNLKGEVQLFKGNKLTLFNNFAKKERNARGASDLNPIETTHAAEAP